MNESDIEKRFAASDLRVRRLFRISGIVFLIMGLMPTSISIWEHIRNYPFQPELLIVGIFIIVVGITFLCLSYGE